MPEKIILSPEERKKRIYFGKLALRMRKAFEMHIAGGLWERNAQGEKDWQNVSRHCLVECARAEIFADVLRLSGTVKDQLLTAAIMHDFHKRQEVELTREKGGDWEAYAESGLRAKETMMKLGVSNEIQEIAGATSHESLPNIEQLCQKDELSELEIAYLIMFYIDEYTINDREVVPADQGINDLNRRINKNDTNPNYQKLNEDGQRYLKGETTSQAEKRICDLLEARMARLILEITGSAVEPKKIPEWIEEQLKERIRA